MITVGDIVYRKLLIEDGAQFEGKCDLASIEKESEKNNTWKTTIQGLSPGLEIP